MSLFRRTLDVVLAVLVVALGVVSASAQITLNADFDSASLCLSPSNACDDNGIASSVSGSTVTLVGRDNFNAGAWKWMYFRADNVNGQTVLFQTGDDFATGGASLNNHRMMYSYDQTNWQFFDNNQRSAGLFTFSNNSPFTQSSVYVAYGPAYPYQRTVDHTAAIASSPWVSPTTSGNSSLVLSQSPGGVDDISRTVTPKNLYGYKITDAAAAGPKAKIVLLSGVHANETLGNFTLEGLVDFLVSDDLEAGRLRRYAEFYVYPMANPDGRFAGNNRSTIQRPSVDPNRAWNPPGYFDPENVTPALFDIAEVGESMRADTEQNIDYMIDFHSTVNPSPYPYHHGLVLPAWQSDPFWLSLLSREPNVITGSAALTDFTGAKFGRDVLNAEFSATFETVFPATLGGLPASENVPRFLTLGRNFGLAWHDVYYVPADLNFDGALDEDDWTLFIAGSETDMDGLSPIEKYELGDLTGNGQNSFEDFELFKQLFDAANGAGSFAAMLAGVPEPSTTALLLMTGLLLAGNSKMQRTQSRAMNWPKQNLIRTEE
jgi:hypothetical protein